MFNGFPIPKPDGGGASGRKSASGTVALGSGTSPVNVELKFVPSVLLGRFTGGMSGNEAKYFLSNTWFRANANSYDCFSAHTVKPTTKTLIINTNYGFATGSLDWLAIE